MKLADCLNVITDYVANGSFASLRENASYVNKEDGFARVIRLTDYNANYDESCAIYVNKNAYQFLSKSKLTSGDIIITNVGAYLGTVFQCPNLNIPMTLGPNAILIKPNEQIVLNKYLYYLLSSDYGHSKLISLVSGSAMPKFNKTDLKKMEIDICDFSLQQHIVNTIGSIDDLVENLQAQINNLIKIGLLKIDELNEKEELLNFSNIASLNKGFEVGSANYFEGYKEKSIHYIRVGDLNSLSNTFVKESNELKIANENDVLIAFDGAPGRNAVGVSGAYSSGIYKVNTNQKNKGLCFFELNSKMNQKIISDHSQGTTILHASKSIEHLKTVGVEHAEKFDPIFNQIVLLKKKINLLKNQKNLLLEKYFTN